MQEGGREKGGRKGEGGEGVPECPNPELASLTCNEVAFSDKYLLSTSLLLLAIMSLPK